SAEDALVYEAEFLDGLACGEGDTDLQMLLIRDAGFGDQQLAGHAQMDHDGVVAFVDGDPEVFTASLASGHLLALQSGCEVLWPVGMATQAARVEHVNVGNHAVSGPLLDTASDDFDFWQF